MNYKKCKPAKELISHLGTEKSVDFIETTKEKAEEILIRNNYINVITPFKHHFADLDENGANKYESIRDDEGRHIYSERSDFSGYYALYKAEREEYLILYNSISKFELLFITQLTFHFMKKYSVTNQKSALIGFDQLLNRVDTTVIRSTGDTESIAHRREKMKGHLEKCKRTLQGSTRKDGTTNHPTDIYLMFDRLYLTEMLTIYMCLKGLERKKIYEQMKKRGLNLGAEDHNDFDTKIFNLVAIRNCVMHFNSLEIVMKYSNYKTKEIRGTSSRADYASIIRSLRYIDKLDEHFIV